MQKIFFAGAGSAGHVEPALAVAQWLRENTLGIEVHFLGTLGGLETSLVPAANFPLHLIDKVPFPRHFNRQLLTWLGRFRAALESTQKLMTGADLVIGFGGYVAAPAYLSARRAGIPIIAHEANAKMGLANRVAKICGAKMLYAFGEREVDTVGIPLRVSIVNLALLQRAEREVAKKAALRHLNLDPDALTILVFGGSLGSAKFNETIAAAQPEICRRGFQIIHAVGAKNQLPQSQGGYLAVPYIDDMALAYSAADLVIARSGAVTVTETGVLGIYSLYIPLPIGNGEQAENAKAVTHAGGGESLKNKEFTPDWLLSNIDRLGNLAKEWSSKGNKTDFPLYASASIAAQALKVLAYE